MERLFTADLKQRIAGSGVVAVLVIDEATEAVAVAPEMLAGVGTILTPRQVEEVKAAGADFGVAPGYNPRVVDTALATELPSPAAWPTPCPGTSTSAPGKKCWPWPGEKCSAE